MIEMNDNAGWCWFQDERALIVGGDLIAGTVADDSGIGGSDRKGNIELSVFDLEALSSRRVVLHEGLEDDDHNAPALLMLPDGNILAAYGRHGSDSQMRWRVTERSDDLTRWSQERTADAGAAYTYQNLHLLSEEGSRIYNLHRGVGFNPNFLVSDDLGQTFRYGGRLLEWDPDSGSGLGGAGRPYLRYSSNSVDTIHFITTEDHPRNFDNSIYHGSFRGGELRDSWGRPLAALSTSRSAEVGPTSFTRVFEGDAEHVAWTVDLELDDRGFPVSVFSVQHGDGSVKRDRDAGGGSIHYYYARFDGSRWHVSSALYAPEVDYCGLAAIDPGHPEVVFISTDADPETGMPLRSAADGLRHYEIYRGVTEDFGRSWRWSPITANSSEDNLRPHVPSWDGSSTALLWMRGTYRSYRDYSTRLVCALFRAPG
jgi:hypothetical protein